jgi:hypothetical protein
MRAAASDEAVPTVAVARRSLESAWDDLDHAVLALPDAFGDDVIASPGLLALLLRVVVARRHLAGAELLDPAGIAGVFGGPAAPAAGPPRWA